MTQETYYAIRIGNPRRHHPYFMLHPKTLTPWLFDSARTAECERRKAGLKNDADIKVVRVTVTECRSGKGER